MRQYAYMLVSKFSNLSLAYKLLTSSWQWAIEVQKRNTFGESLRQILFTVEQGFGQRDEHCHVGPSHIVVRR